MAEFNLLKTNPKIIRDVAARLVNKEENRRLALQYGFEYFDGPREQGYGGYRYDGRWKAVAETALAHFGLRAGMRVLDLGCAKGFFVKDLIDKCPGIDAYGLDVSTYAITQCPPEIIGRLHLGDIEDPLPFPDDSFDAVFCINTLHNLDEAGCVAALREINRLARVPRRCFVQVDAFTNEAERGLFQDWMLTAKTYKTPKEWLELFGRAGYLGDHYWTIMRMDEAVGNAGS